MICRQCGREISPPAGACPYCHSPVLQTAAKLVSVANCPSCGEPTSPDRLRCSVCAFDRAVEPVVPCRSCARIVAASARFCWSCGTPVDLPASPPQAVPVPPAPPTPPVPRTPLDQTFQAVERPPAPPPPPGPPAPPAPPKSPTAVDKVGTDQTVAKPVVQPPAPPPAPVASTGPIPPAPPKPAAPAAPPAPPMAMPVPPRMSPMPAPPASAPAVTMARPVAGPARTRLLPILLGVALVLVLIVGAGGFAFWKFYWVPRSQQTETVDQSLTGQTLPASDAKSSTTSEQTGSSASDLSQPIDTGPPPETSPPDVSRETQSTDSEPTNRFGTDEPKSTVRKPDTSTARPVADDEYPTSPVIATQDSPVSSAPPDPPVDAGQADRPVSQSVPDDAPAPVVTDDSATAHPVQPPPPSDPVRRQPAPYEGPSRGTLVWTGEVVKGDQVVIENESANRGTVTGALPGVPCTISLNSSNVAVSEAPGPRNRYRRLGLRFNQKGRVSVVVTWEVIK